MKDRPWRYWLLYLTSFPELVLTQLVVLLIWLLWGTKLQWVEGLWCELKPGSWPCRTWYRIKIDGRYQLNPPQYQEQFGRWRTWGGTTFGHGGFYGPGRTRGKGIDTDIEFHEHVHTEQGEVALLAGLLLAAIISTLSFVLHRDANNAVILGAVIWTLSNSLHFGSGWVVAYLRGEDPYRGSSHEESAYAQEAVHHDEEKGGS